MRKKVSLDAGNVILPACLFLLCFGALTAYYLFAGLMAADLTYAAYVVVYGSFLILFYVFVRAIEGSSLAEYGFVLPRRNKLVQSVIVALALTAVFSLVVLEPGFVFGFARQPSPALLAFGFFLFSAPLVATAQEAVFRGYIFKKLATRTSVSIGLLVSSLLFALQATNPFAFSGLGFGGAVQYTFSNTFTAFALGITMGLYFYKSGWNLLGPIIVRWGLLLQSNLSPIVALTTGWEFTFVFELIGFAAMILLTNALVKEPRLLARNYLDLRVGLKRFRFLQRARSRSEVKRALRTLAIAGTAVILLTVAFQATLGSSVHLAAIPTGSMRPALDPGTLVIVQSTSGPSQIHVGDIVEYSASFISGNVVHRVIAEKAAQGGALFTTKGDNNTSPDPLPVPYNKVIGKVVFSVPYLGFLVLSPPLDVALIVFLFMASVLGSSLKSPNPRMKWRSID